MALSNQMRRLLATWHSGGAWPKRLEWIEIRNIRGWTGQRITFRFPIVAVVGENGTGKSTVIQAAASVYRGTDKGSTRFPSEFFPVTAWDQVTRAEIVYAYREGDNSSQGKVRKPTSRWLGHAERPIRRVEYVDLRRIQPISARVGYTKLVKTKHKEASSTDFEDSRVRRLSAVMGRTYDSARIAVTDVDDKRQVPVISMGNVPYSGFHQGSGETTIFDFLKIDPPPYSLLLIDEIESSLHPRAQRRLIRELAERCRERQLQIVLTTHSPYVLDELPLEARVCILNSGAGRETVTGVSPDFAMMKMDDEPHPECELYVEDDAAAVMLNEIMAHHQADLVSRCRITPFGASNLGKALGQMVAGKRFPEPTCVFLDGDNAGAPGCILLPGDDAPERVVFDALREVNWGNVSSRVGRDFAAVADACAMAMTLGEHHEWVNAAASRLTLAGQILWHAMCAEWASTCLEKDYAAAITRPIEDAIIAANQ